MTTEKDDTVINAEYTEKPAGTAPAAPKKEEGILGKFAAYVKKNRDAEEKRRIKAGEKSFSEELGDVGSNWGKNLMKGMKEVGDEQEASLTGRKKRPTGGFVDSEDVTDEVLFGRKRSKQPAVEGARSANDLYGEAQFIEKLCEFLRYVEEDDNVKLCRIEGKAKVVDYVYLSRLLTRFYGHKITLKERDLSIK